MYALFYVSSSSGCNSKARDPDRIDFAQLFFESFPLVFGDIYGFNIGEQGLAFLGKHEVKRIRRLITKASRLLVYRLPGDGLLHVHHLRPLPEVPNPTSVRFGAHDPGRQARDRLDRFHFDPGVNLDLW